eukprot:Skav235714  [mRNA]  locus=scaffold280:539254:540839:+ [translate_table: standard]
MQAMAELPPTSWSHSFAYLHAFYLSRHRVEEEEELWRGGVEEEEELTTQPDFCLLAIGSSCLEPLLLPLGHAQLGPPAPLQSLAHAGAVISAAGLTTSGSSLALRSSGCSDPFVLTFHMANLDPVFSLRSSAHLGFLPSVAGFSTFGSSLSLRRCSLFDLSLPSLGSGWPGLLPSAFDFLHLESLLLIRSFS